MFKLEEFMGKRVLKSSLLEGLGGDVVTAFFTTRDLPLKSGERDDLIEEVENNKKLLCEGLGIPLQNLVIPVQTHSDNVAVVKREKEKGKSEENNPSPYENTDALVTNERNIALALNFADCVPIIFYDPTKNVVAVAHAGWRGTAAKIAVKTVEKMVSEFGTKSEDIIVLIGPAINKCCFKVGQNVAEQLLETIDAQHYAEVIDGAFVDLKLINKFQLLASGLKKIDVSEYCTSCQSGLFFSYRQEKRKTARHSAVIVIRSSSN